ncbi:hypothetical protein CPB84DRAFT_1474760 [Gymnopilus junonius]|uniref:Uncharacterized protein n=1 Tax=Gymnopilus junonius TaxID=109634 RepID=A0A9P5TKR6_GYMJU|nr:hypothetical protein CPB84DRAFT_1474760 [Gymnopilus junonius]
MVALLLSCAPRPPQLRFLNETLDMYSTSAATCICHLLACKISIDTLELSKESKIYIFQLACLSNQRRTLSFQEKALGQREGSGLQLEHRGCDGLLFCAMGLLAANVNVVGPPVLVVRTVHPSIPPLLVLEGTEEILRIERFTNSRAGRYVLGSCFLTQHYRQAPGVAHHHSLLPLLRMSLHHRVHHRDRASGP